MKRSQQQHQAIDLLLVEDSATDVFLTKSALEDCEIPIRLHVVTDGLQALNYLRRKTVRRPDLILLDLNLPKKDGREVLREIKADKHLRQIPVIVLTTSQDPKDVKRAYDLYANSYITKPVNFEHFSNVVRQIESYWFSVSTLP